MWGRRGRRTLHKAARQEDACSSSLPSTPRKGTVSDMQSKSLRADVRSRGLPRELASTKAHSLHRPSTRRC